MGKLIDLTGKTFGYYTVLEYLGDQKWRCKCKCGNIKIVKGQKLRNGLSRSCGCAKSEFASKSLKKHGLSNTHVYKIVMGIIQRCTDKNCENYPRYGGRGVRIYKPWRENPGEFAQWLLDHGWKPGLQVDKDIKDQFHLNGYYPTTISFVKKNENSRHTRRNRMITYNGESHPLCVWEKITGISQRVITARLNTNGWTVEAALTVPVNPSGKNFKGVYKDVKSSN